jgi:hypothetical protein
MYGAILLLALFVVSTFTLLEHGSQGLGRVETYTPDAMPIGPAYNGSEIAINGTLVYNDSLDRFELTNPEAEEPTPLEGLDEDELRPYEGLLVHVNGTFILNGNDFHLEAKNIRALHETASPTPTPSPF